MIIRMIVEWCFNVPWVDRGLGSPVTGVVHARVVRRWEGYCLQFMVQCRFHLLAKLLDPNCIWGCALLEVFKVRSLGFWGVSIIQKVGEDVIPRICQKGFLFASFAWVIGGRLAYWYVRGQSYRPWGVQWVIDCWLSSCASILLFTLVIALVWLRSQWLRWFDVELVMMKLHLFKGASWIHRHCCDWVKDLGFNSIYERCWAVS